MTSVISFTPSVTIVDTTPTQTEDRDKWQKTSVNLSNLGIVHIITIILTFPLNVDGYYIDKANC